MRKALVLCSCVMLALSVMITGTTLAQDGDDTPTAAAWLGVYVADSDAGVVVTRVSRGSPAETDGLLADDVIVSVDDQVVDSSDSLIALVEAHAAGDVIAVTVQREDSEQVLSITLGSSADRRPGQSDRFPGDMGAETMAASILRVQVSAVEEGYQVTALNVRPGQPGDSQDDSQDDSEADDEAGLLEGDIITAVNDTPIAEVDWQTVLTDLTGQEDATLTLTVLRDGSEITITLDVVGSMLGGGQGPMGQPGQGQGQPGGGQGSIGQPGQGQPGQGGDDAPVEPGDNSGTQQGISV